jgi:hypothetical protein
MLELIYIIMLHILLDYVCKFNMFSDSGMLFIINSCSYEVKTLTYKT